jgi:hypothetical protein
MWFSNFGEISYDFLSISKPKADGLLEVGTT